MSSALSIILMVNGDRSIDYLVSDKASEARKADSHFGWPTYVHESPSVSGISIEDRKFFSGNDIIIEDVYDIMKMDYSEQEKIQMEKAPVEMKQDYKLLMGVLFAVPGNAYDAFVENLVERKTYAVRALAPKQYK